MRGPTGSPFPGRLIRLGNRGDFPAAVAKLKAANQRGPDWADPLKAWGDVLVKEGKTREALAKYDEAPSMHRTGNSSRKRARRRRSKSPDQASPKRTLTTGSSGSKAPFRRRVWLAPAGQERKFTSWFGCLQADIGRRSALTPCFSASTRVKLVNPGPTFLLSRTWSCLSRKMHEESRSFDTTENAMIP
jgi:hypothetical protein